MTVLIILNRVEKHMTKEEGKSNDKGSYKNTLTELK